MTGFDMAVMAIIGMSALVALVRGLVREVLALATWIAAVLLAFAEADGVAQWLRYFDLAPAVAQVIAFVIVLVGVLIAGGLVAMLVSRGIRAVGLGWLDRLLGGAFGVARGLVLVLLAVLLAGLTSLPRARWWQDAVLAPSLVAAALELRDWLPPGWAARLDFSADGSTANSAAPRGFARTRAREI